MWADDTRDLEDVLDMVLSEKTLVQSQNFQIPGLSQDECTELAYYQTHTAFADAYKNRRRAFTSMLEVLVNEYNERENEIHKSIAVPFADILKQNGIAETRKRSVPAYAFDKFLQLPKEIQLLIWEKAVPVDEPRVRVLTSNKAPMWSGKLLIQIFTAVFDESEDIYSDSPSKRHEWFQGICPDAKIAFQNVYKELPFIALNPEWFKTRVYNVRDDQFYLAQDSWGDFKILTALVALRYQSVALGHEVPPRPRPLPPLASKLLQIQHLMVDLAIFGAAPKHIWSQFPHLESLTIVFYNFPRITDRERPIYDHYYTGTSLYDAEFYGQLLKFYVPPAENKYGRRAAAIRKLGERSFAEVARTLDWKPPRLKVVLRTDGNEDYDEQILDPEDDSRNKRFYTEDDREFHPVAEGTRRNDDTAYLNDLSSCMAQSDPDVNVMRGWEDWDFMLMECT